MFNFHCLKKNVFLQVVCLKEDPNKVHTLDLVDKYLISLLVTDSLQALPFIAIYLLKRMDHLHLKIFYILDLADFILKMSFNMFLYSSYFV